MFPGIDGDGGAAGSSPGANSKSRTAVGAGMVDSWVKNVIKVARLVVLVMVGDSVSAITLKSMLSNKIGGHCDQAAIGEVLKFPLASKVSVGDISSS